MLGKIVAAALGGLLVAGLASLVVAVMLSSNPRDGGQAVGIVFLLAWAASALVALLAPRAAKAWRRLLIASGILSFSLPLAAFIFTGLVVNQEMARGGEYAEAAAAGAALGGGMVVALTGLLGFFLGLIFLVIGLLVGRDKQVVVVRETTGPAS